MADLVLLRKMGIEAGTEDLASEAGVEALERFEQMSEEELEAFCEAMRSDVAMVHAHVFLPNFTNDVQQLCVLGFESLLAMAQRKADLEATAQEPSP